MMLFCAWFLAIGILCKPHRANRSGWSQLFNVVYEFYEVFLHTFHFTMNSMWILRHSPCRFFTLDSIAFFHVAAGLCLHSQACWTVGYDGQMYDGTDDRCLAEELLGLGLLTATVGEGWACRGHDTRQVRSDSIMDPPSGPTPSQMIQWFPSSNSWNTWDENMNPKPLASLAQVVPSVPKKPPKHGTFTILRMDGPGLAGSGTRHLRGLKECVAPPVNQDHQKWRYRQYRSPRFCQNGCSKQEPR